MQAPEAVDLAFVSTSLAEQSRSRILCRHGWAWSRGRGLEVELIDLSGRPVLPHGHPEAGETADLEARLAKAGALVIGMPVYNFSLGSELKALVEACGEALEGKVVGLLCAAGGRSAFMAPMAAAQSLMLDFRCWIVPRYVYAVGEDFEGEGIANPEVRRRVEELVEVTWRTAWQHRQPAPVPRG